MSRITFRPVVASIVLALATGALAAPAFAAVGDAPAAAAPAPHHAGKGPGAQHWQGMRDGLWLPGIGPIGKQEVTQLKLDASQQALFKTAQDSQRDFFKSMRESAQARHKTLDDQLKAGQLDPHALATADVQNRQNRESQANQVRQNWLAVWDGLNDGQRQQVTTFVKARQAKWEAHKDGHHGHRPAAPAPAPQSAS